MNRFQIVVVIYCHKDAPKSFNVCFWDFAPFSAFNDAPFIYSSTSTSPWHCWPEPWLRKTSTSKHDFGKRSCNSLNHRQRCFRIARPFLCLDIETYLLLIQSLKDGNMGMLEGGQMTEGSKCIILERYNLRNGANSWSLERGNLWLLCNLSLQCIVFKGQNHHRNDKEI